MGNRLDGGVRLNYLGKSGENIIYKNLLSSSTYTLFY